MAFGLLLLVMAAVGRAPADESKLEDVNPNGRPKGYKAGLSARYAIWHEAATWHIRTTSAKDTHVFSGTIQVMGGRMTSLKPITVEKGGKSKTNLDYGSWNPEGTLFTFSFTTGKGQDGFDLQLNDKATELTFVLKVDGKEAPDKVFLGAKNAHPKAASFRLAAHPGK